jgi:hypothetical protein
MPRKVFGRGHTASGTTHIVVIFICPMLELSTQQRKTGISSMKTIEVGI